MDIDEKQTTLENYTVLDLNENTNDTIQPNQILPTDVCINIPYIYVHTDENDCKDTLTLNIRVINYEQLKELMKLSHKIHYASNNEQIELSQSLINRLLAKSSSDQQFISELLNFINVAVDISKDLDVEDEHTDIDTHAINTDIIRNYIVDQQTGILISCEPITYNNYSLYSQITDANLKLELRKHLNDTDFNRIQYELSCYEKILLFQPHYIYNKTVKIVNLTLFYLNLISESKSIEGYSMMDVKSNLFGYILDVILRSRLIQAWHRNPMTKKLLMDIIKNYDENHPLVNLCRLETGKARANYLLKQLHKVPEFSKYTQPLNFSIYENILNKCIQEYNNSTYYVFNNQFLLYIATVPELKTLIECAKKINDSSV